MVTLFQTSNLFESRMRGNLHVRFGGGRLEKGWLDQYLAGRLPDVRHVTAHDIALVEG
jgi:hypothetical protein